MEVYQEQIIDIALNVLGYLAGGALWLVVYTAWRNRASQTGMTSVTDALASSVQDVQPAAAIAHPAAADAEFLDLRSVKQTEPAPKPQPPRPARTGLGRRNHGEVFALARTMLEKGATAETIKATVPISDGELALLTGK
ncbi:hypothetical protein KQH82_07755 [bacterium]|nr:hypothetical protein [bacterium]